MHRNGAKAMLGEGFYQNRNITFAVTENHRVFQIFAPQQVTQNFAFLFHISPRQMLGNSVGCAGRWGNLDNLWVAHEFRAELVNIIRQGCREEQGLAQGRQ